MTTARQRKVESGARGYALAASALFAALAAAVASGETQDADMKIRRRQPRPRGGVVRTLAKGVKVAAKPGVQLPFAAIVTLGLRRARVTGSDAVLGAALGGFLIDKGCKRLLPRKRPPGYRGHESDQSFPSGHTTAVAGLAFTVAGLLERQHTIRAPAGILAAAVLTALVGETRLLLDEHWPSDVVGGALLGSAVACTALAMVRRPGGAHTRLHRPRSRRQPGATRLSAEAQVTREKLPRAHAACRSTLALAHSAQ